MLLGVIFQKHDPESFDTNNFIKPQTLNIVLNEHIAELENPCPNRKKNCKKNGISQTTLHRTMKDLELKIFHRFGNKTYNIKRRPQTMKQ